MNSPYSAYSDEPTGGFAYPLLYNTVHCSRETAGVDAAAVDSIIQSSRRWNPENGITGLLVFGSGMFFQWLEGPRDTVTSLMERLRTDPRHENVVALTGNRRSARVPLPRVGHGAGHHHRHPQCAGRRVGQRHRHEKRRSAEAAVDTTRFGGVEWFGQNSRIRLKINS